MVEVTLEDAQGRLGELIASGVPGEEIGIVQGDRLVAKLVPVIADDKPRRPGSAAKGRSSTWPDDFDAPLDDFRE